MREYIIEIDPCCWLAPWGGPTEGRTGIKSCAKTFSRAEAVEVLERVRVAHNLPAAKMVEAPPDCIGLSACDGLLEGCPAND